MQQISKVLLHKILFVYNYLELQLKNPDQTMHWDALATYSYRIMMLRIHA